MDDLFRALRATQGEMLAKKKLRIDVTSSESLTLYSNLDVLCNSVLLPRDGGGRFTNASTVE